MDCRAFGATSRHCDGSQLRRKGFGDFWERRPKRLVHFGNRAAGESGRRICRRPSLIGWMRIRPIRTTG
jgi:hypothetical protein